MHDYNPIDLRHTLKRILFYITESWI